MIVMVGKMMLYFQRRIEHASYVLFKRIVFGDSTESTKAQEEYTSRLIQQIAGAYALGTITGYGRLPSKKLKKLAFSEPLDEKLTIAIKKALKDNWIFIQKIVRTKFASSEEAINSVFKPHASGLKFLRGYTIQLAKIESQELLNEMTDAVRHTLYKGMSEREAIKYLEQRFKQFEKKRVRAIARTEVTRAFNHGNIAATIQYVEGYRFTAVLDAKTTEICQARHEKFLPKDTEILVENTPPLHVNCRSYLIPLLKAKGEHITKGMQPLPEKRQIDLETTASMLKEVISSSY